MSVDFYDLFKPPAEERPLSVVPQISAEGATKYAAAALRREAAEVAATPNGSRNDRLNKAWFNMGRHVGAGGIDVDTVRNTLADAARSAGLPEDEIALVLRDDSTSAVHAGAEIPRHPEPRPEAPVVTVLEAAAQIEGAELPETPNVNPIIDWHELFATEDDGEEWIVEPLLPARRMVALYSAPKAGKSLLMLEIAVAIARGAPVIGVTPDRPHRVLYVDFENDPRGDVRSRLEAMDLGPSDLDNLCYLTYPTLAKLDTFAGAVDLLRHVTHYECEVVVIDTLSRAVGGEENDNDTWLAFYRNTGLALKQAGVACIRLDHSGKDREKGMRGGSAKYGDVDAVWRLTAINEETVLLECTDHRMRVPTLALTLTRQDYPLAHVVVGDPRAIVDAQVREVDELLDRVGVPTDAGEKRAGKALREAGHKVNNRALREAIKTRRLRLDVPANNQGQRSDLTPSQLAPGASAAQVARPGQLAPGAGGSLETLRRMSGGAPGAGAAQGSEEGDLQVACRSCHRPTSAVLAAARRGLCSTCERTDQG